MHNTDMHCANCGAERAGPYCARCGQNDRDYQRSLPPLVGELLRETFEVDSRLTRTLRLLILKPGELAAEFSRNRRASYVSPIRLYLFISLAFFFLISIGTDVSTTSEDNPGVRVQTEADSDADADTGRLLSLLADDPDRGDVRVRRAQDILARPETATTRLALLLIAKSINELEDELGDEALSPLQVYLINETVDALYEPGSVMRQFMDNLAVGMMIMLPVYALLLKLFYLKRRRYYVETLVFSTHLHSFVFLVFMADMLVNLPTGISWLDGLLDFASSLLMMWIYVYHYLALRRYFAEGRAKTMMKYAGLLSLYFLLLAPTAFLVVLAVTVIQV